MTDLNILNELAKKEIKAGIFVINKNVIRPPGSTPVITETSFHPEGSGTFHIDQDINSYSC